MRTPASSLTTTSDRLANVLSYGALLLLGYLVFRIVEPFLVPIAWSAVLAIFFFPMHERVLRRLKPAAASLASTLAVTLLLVVPALFVLSLTAREGLDASAALQKTLLDPNAHLPARVLAWLRHALPAGLQSAGFSNQIQQAAERTASFLASKLAGLLKNLLSFFFDLFLMIFALFFMFRDGEAFVRVVRYLLPFDEAIQRDMIRESRDLIFASVAVGLTIAAVQGVLGGTAFALVRLPTPIFWGVLIAFLSLVPVVGSALVWAPAALWLAFTGHWVKGLVVVGICGGIAGVTDNILRPVLLHKRTQLNGLLLFVSVLGGISLFGLLGLVAGPAIVAAAMGIFRVYMEHREPQAATSA